MTTHLNYPVTPVIQSIKSLIQQGLQPNKIVTITHNNEDRLSDDCVRFLIQHIKTTQEPIGVISINAHQWSTLRDLNANQMGIVDLAGVMEMDVGEIEFLQRFLPHIHLNTRDNDTTASGHRTRRCTTTSCAQNLRNPNTKSHSPPCSSDDADTAQTSRKPNESHRPH